MSEQLPIKKIFYKGIAMPFEHYKELMRLGWPYAFLIIASSFIPEVIEGIALKISYYTLICFTGVLCAVGCHRIFLLPEELVSKTPTVRWGDRETRFFLYAIGMVVLSSVILVPMFLVVIYLVDLASFSNEKNQRLIGLAFTIATVPMYYLFSRWSLVLPSAAVDNNRTPSWAWDISSGYGFRLFVLIGAIPLTTSFMAEFLAALLGPSYLLSLIQNAIWFVVGIIEICLLSLSYEWIEAQEESRNDD